MIKPVRARLSMAQGLGILLSLFLGGCSAFPSSDPPCMKTALVSALSRAPLYPAIEGDMRSVVISDFRGGCGGASSDLPGGEGEIGVVMTLTIPEAKQRLHKEGQKVAFPIFVALLDKEDNVIERLDEKIEIPIDRHPFTYTHKIIYRPPPGIDVKSENHRLLAGFNGSVAAVPASSLALSRDAAPERKSTLKRKSRKGKRRQKADGAGKEAA